MLAHHDAERSRRLSRSIAGLCLLLASAGAAHPAQALLEEPLTSSQRIPGLSVDADRFPGQVTVLTAEDLRRLRPATIQQALAQLPGVVFSDQQGFGLASNSTLNLRGIVNSSRTNTLVLVDGIRQNRLTGDEVHWQAIPIDQVERIEIIRGGGGLIYGEGALAGVINILTKQGGDRPLSGESSTEIGSFGWQRYALSAQGASEPLRYGLAYTRRLVDGYREFSWSRNTTIRSNTGFDLLPGVSADLHVAHSEDTTAFPGLLTLAQTQTRRIQTNAFHGLNTTETDQVGLDLVAGPHDGASGVLSVFWGRRVQTSQDSIAFNSFTVTPSRGLSLRTSQEWVGSSAANLLVSGVELGEDKATTGDPGAGPDSEVTRGGYGFYVEDTLTLAERVSVVAGLRFDKSRYEASLSFPDYNGTLRFEGWSPRVGASFVAVPDHLRLFAAYARPFKSPNVDDFSSRVSSIARSNADLLPQQADTYELGVVGDAGPVTASATAFYVRIKDEILYNNRAFVNQNFDTRRYGTEFSVQVAPVEGRVRTSAAYTFVDAEFRKGALQGLIIPGSPQHTLVTRLGVSPLEGLWVDLNWRLVHDAVRINDMDNILGGADNYGVVDLLAQYTLPARPHRPETSVYLRIENLTNEEYVTYQSSNSVNLFTGAGEAPMPPIAFTGGVVVRF